MITPLWLSGSWRSFLYSSSVYSCHLFLFQVKENWNWNTNITKFPHTLKWKKPSTVKASNTHRSHLSIQWGLTLRWRFINKAELLGVWLGLHDCLWDPLKGETQFQTTVCEAVSVNIKWQLDWVKGFPDSKLVKHYFWVCLWGCFWKRLTFELSDPIKIALTDIQGQHPIRWESE